MSYGKLQNLQSVAGAGHHRTSLFMDIQKQKIRENRVIAKGPFKNYVML